MDNRIVGESVNGYGKIGYEYDELGRMTKRKYQDTSGAEKCSERYIYLTENEVGQTNECRTTNYVCRIEYAGTQDVNNIAETYSYDANGNIKSITEGETETSYEYDGVGRLIRENDGKAGKTRLYEYDKSRNIERIREYDYTVAENYTNEEVTTYSYSTGTRKDELVKVEKKRSADGSILSSYNISSYDNLGNPCNYKGSVIEWKRGRELCRYGSVQVEYDASGTRRKKIADGRTIWYDVEGERIHKETRGTESIWYYYDGTGIAGLEYNGEKYYFQKSLQGDVKRILNTNGELVAKYEYDAWGNHKVLNADGTENTSATFIGNINPFRYRGYYYDIETKLYYLQSRYYDPEIRRFINADDVSYIDPETINGLNLYAYCGNNPVMRTDSQGTNWWTDFWNGVGNWFQNNWIKLVIGTAFVVAGAVVTFFTAGMGTAGLLAAGSALLASAKAVGISMAVSAGIGAVVGGISGGWEGALQGFGNGLADGFMWGGIFAGSAQILGGASKLLSSRNVDFSEKFNWLFGNRNSQSTTLLRVNRAGKQLFRIDASVKELWHLHYGATSALMRIHRTGIALFSYLVIANGLKGLFGGF